LYGGFVREIITGGLNSVNERGIERIKGIVNKIDTGVKNLRGLSPPSPIPEQLLQ
jgi:hypothetical protein